MKSFWGITAVLLTVTVAGCAPRSMSGDVYSREQAQMVQTIRYGEVIEVRQILIEGTKSGAGTLAGGVLGGALGSGVGRGSGTGMAVVGGAILGAVAGSAVEEAATKQPGLEITIRMDTGRTIALVQGLDPPVRVGDRVRVVRNPNGSARAIPVAEEPAPRVEERAPNSVPERYR
jgi:outer membrane lipoprotein SlyB